MSEQAKIELPAGDGPAPEADAALKEQSGKQPSDGDAAKAAADNGDQRSEDGDRKAATDKAADDKASAREAGTNDEVTRTSNAEHRTPNSEGKAVADLTAERDTAVKDRDALKAEVDRLAKLTGKPVTPPAGGGGKGKQTADEWLVEQLAK